MAAIVQQRRPNSGDEWTRGIQAVGSVIGQVKAAGVAQAQEARAQETHEADIAGKGISNKEAQLELDLKREAVEITGYKDDFEQGNLLAQEQGVQYKPSFKDFTPRQARAFSDWQVEQMGQDVKLTEESMKMHKMQASQQYEGIQKEWQGAVGAMSGSQPDMTTAIKHMEAGYEMHNDGADIIFNADQKSYTVKMADGQTKSASFDSSEAMFQDFADKMAPLQGEKGQENYFNTYIKDQKDRQKRNALGILKSTYYTNEKGEEVQAANLEGPDGRPDLRFRMWDKDGNDMGMISKEAFMAGKFKDVTQRKKEADIGKVKAEAAKERRVGVAETRKGWSPERKLAADLADTIKALDGDVDKAMRMVQKAKNAKNLLAAQKIATDQLLLDPNTPEFEAFMKAVTTKLPPKATKVKPVGGLPTGTTGADVDKAESETGRGVQKEAAKNTPPKDYPNAKQAPDGEWYIQKDGKTFRVKR